MKIKLKDNKIFRSTVEGEDIRVGAEPVEVKESTGRYLLENFSDILEKAKNPKEDN